MVDLGLGKTFCTLSAIDNLMFDKYETEKGTSHIHPKDSKHCVAERNEKMDYSKKSSAIQL